MGTVALGALFGRTMPVVVVALIACLFARATWEPLTDAYVLHGMAVLPDAGCFFAGRTTRVPVRRSVPGRQGLHGDGLHAFQWSARVPVRPG